MEIEEVPIIRSMAAVKAWFFAQDSAKFTLYAGYGKVQGESMRSTKDEKIEQTDLAWKELENCLSWCNFKGSFTLMVTQSKNGTGGGKTCKIALKGDNTEGAAIGSLGQGFLTEEQFDRRLQDALHRERQERKIQDLEAQVQGLVNGGGEKQGFWERMAEKALENDQNGEAINGIADSLREIGTGIKYMLMTKAGGGRRPERQSARASREKKTDKEPENTEGGNEYDGNEILEMFEATENLIPDCDPLAVHKAMIKMFSEMSEGEREFLINEKLKPNL